MSLDKRYLKYKLEKIKNDRIEKDMSTPAKFYQRQENGKLAKEEADAIHAYITGEDKEFNDNSFLSVEEVFFGDTGKKKKKQKLGDYGRFKKSLRNKGVGNKKAERFVIKTYKSILTWRGRRLVGVYKQITVEKGLITEVKPISFGTTADVGSDVV